MIERIAIRGYKSLADVEAYLHPLTVIIGPNGAGKSNLLDAMSLLSRMVTEQNLERAFAGHRGNPIEAFYYGDTGLQQLISEGSAQFCIEVDITLSDSVVKSVEDRIAGMREGLEEPRGLEVGRKRRILERHLRYRVTVEMMTGSGHLRVIDERLSALMASRGEPSAAREEKSPASRVPFLSREGAKLHLRVEGQSHPMYRDIGLDHCVVSEGLYAPHFPHVSAFKEELASWRFYYLEPSAIRRDAPLREVNDIGRDGHDLAAFLNSVRVNKPDHFKDLQRALAELLPSVRGIRVDLTKDGVLQLMIEEDGVEYSARVASEGTLRILGLLAVTSHLSDATVVGYEEPENGVHPERLKLAARLLQESADIPRQVIVSTHSPLLPEYLGDNNLLVCKRAGHRSVFEPFRGTGLFRSQEIAAALSDGQTPLSTRIVRGDFSE